MQPDELPEGWEAVAPAAVVAPSVAPNHEGVRFMTEEQAAELFALPEIRDAAAKVRDLLSEARAHGGQANEHSRNANRHWLEASAMTQAEGGRIHKVRGNMHQAHHLLATHHAERLTAEAEMVWAEVAHKHGCYIPNPWRLEVRMAERPNDPYVYCWDANEDEMAWHGADDCGGTALRHDHPESLLRKWDGSAQQLIELPGRAGLP